MVKKANKANSKVEGKGKIHKEINKDPSININLRKTQPRCKTVGKKIKKFQTNLIQTTNQSDPIILNEEIINHEKNIHDDQFIQPYELIGENKDIKDCISIDMNKDESILINSNKQEIQLRKFHLGKLESIETLQSCQKCVYCVCFSKKGNWFISGGYDFHIIIWEQQENKSWKQIQELNALQEEDYCFQHDLVNSIILSNDENEFVSCSFYSKIKIWIKKQEQWICHQLLQIDTREVYYLSYSPDCQMLGSVGVEELRIWTKKQNKWSQKQICNPYDDGDYTRLCFIQENELIATQSNPDLFLVLIQSKGSFQVKQKIFLPEGTEDQNKHFPILFNKIKNVAIVKNNLQIFIIDRKVNGIYSIRQVINGEYRSGYITQNGDFLIMSKFQEVIIKKKHKKQNKKEFSLQIWKLK